MGIASRTKWESRVQMPLALVRHMDPAKIAHRARLLSAAKRPEPMFAKRRLATVTAERNAELRATRLRNQRLRNKAARGWLPYACR